MNLIHTKTIFSVLEKAIETAESDEAADIREALDSLAGELGWIKTEDAAYSTYLLGYGGHGMPPENANVCTDHRVLAAHALGVADVRRMERPKNRTDVLRAVAALTGSEVKQ